MFSSLIVKISVLSMGTLCLYSSMQSNLPNYIKADIAAPVLEPVVNNLRRSTLALTAGADVRHEQESPASLRSQVTGDAMKYKSTHSGESLSYRVEISDSSENALPSGFSKARYHQIDKSKRYDTCAIGAGLSGTVFAERSANVLGESVLVIDARPHIGGNCYDFWDQKTGILRNQYGSHLFHTKMQHVWDYVTSNPNAPDWKRWYHYKFGEIHRDQEGSKKVDYVPIPPNIMTVNRLLNLDIQTPEEMDEWLKTVQIPCPDDTGCVNAEQMAKSRV